jgi:hypothetical protein
MLGGDFNQTVLGSSLEQLSWKEARADLLKVNPELVSVIDEIDPGKDCRLYRCRYPYGSEVLQRGVMALPNPQGRLVPITDQSIPAQIQTDLGYNYNSNPVSIILKGTMELFFTSENKVSVFGLIPAGRVFGVGHILDESEMTSQPTFLWCFTAGARSVFMLPKISEAISHNQLKRTFQLSIDKPERSIDHWEVFRQLANHQDLSKNPWCCEVIFFSKQWFEKLTDKAWQPLHYYLLRHAWLKTSYMRDLLFWNCIYGLLQSQISVKSSAYLIETVKHIFAMGVGALPGFAPAVDDSAMPVSLIQQAYLEVYRLKNYLPIMMQPHSFDFTKPDARPIYYSLQFPSSLGLIPKTVTGASAMVELSEIDFLFERYAEQVLQEPLNISHTQVYEFVRQAKIDCFHSTVPEHPSLKTVAELFGQDSAFHKVMPPHPDNHVFPETSSFLRGCVRISKK